MKKSLSDYKANKKEVWVRRHPNQIILTVSQIMWAKDVHQILDGRGNKGELMVRFERMGNAVRDLLTIFKIQKKI